MTLRVVGNASSHGAINTREDKWEEMKRCRSKLLNSGCPFDGHWYYTEPDSKLEILSLKVRALEKKIDGGNLSDHIQIDGSPVYIKTIDNGYMPISYNKALGLANAVESRTRQIYAIMAQHKELMWNSSDFLNYNYKTGFPEIYEGNFPANFE